jgi:hypothetical protein
MKQNLIYPLPFEKVFENIKENIIKNDHLVKHIDIDNGIIVFETRKTIWTFGINIKLTFSKENESQTQLMVSTSIINGQLYDWGETKRILNNVLNLNEIAPKEEGLNKNAKSLQIGDSDTVYFTSTNQGINLETLYTKNKKIVNYSIILILGTILFWYIQKENFEDINKEPIINHFTLAQAESAMKTRCINVGHTFVNSKEVRLNNTVYYYFLTLHEETGTSCISRMSENSLEVLSADCGKDWVFRLEQWDRIDGLK